MLLYNFFFHFDMFWENTCSKKFKCIPYSIFVYIFKLIFTKFSQPAFKFDHIHEVKHLHFVQIFSENSLFIEFLKNNFENLQHFCLSCIKLSNLMFFMHKLPHVNICVNNLGFPLPEILPLIHFLEGNSSLNHVYFLFKNFDWLELSVFFVIIITQVYRIYRRYFALNIFVGLNVVDWPWVRNPVIECLELIIFIQFPFWNFWKQSWLSIVFKGKTWFWNQVILGYITSNHVVLNHV